ncbi:PQQ-binding-like beta-propeller repeat protein, partial [Achromobacter sp. GG226]|uniref:outer membrane protein assembly factor BamB family protein n=1 Tax=Verticiella alkaliphila TaxID=2779529 RepID=UPI001C0C2930
PEGSTPAAPSATPSPAAAAPSDVDNVSAEDDARVAPTNAAPGTGAIATGDPTPFTHPGQPIAAEDAHPTNPSCAAMLFMPTADGRVIALNPDDGAICTNFGDGTGQINLWANMPNLNPGSYYSTSPVVVSRDRLVVAGTVLDNVSTTEPSGVIRGYDVRTGALVWNWDSGNPNETAPIGGDRTYLQNSPNSWSISSVDESLGLVYVPMGNQPPDQWGGNRSPAAEMYSSSVVALDLETGRVRWHYQTVHHDLWDYDVPAQPSLVDLTINGQTVPALVQPTKQGELFVLDRRSGQPVLPVNEEPVPQGAAEGDTTAPTQPRSALSFDPPRLQGADMWGATIFDQLACRIKFHRLRYEGRYTPPSEKGSLIYPGNFGTFNWGGVAIDPQRQIVFATPTRLAFVSQLVRREDDTSLYVQGDERPEYSLPALNENFGAPFAVKLHPFMSALGLPCQAPPWGFVAGADLTTGDVAWMHRNGTVRDSSPLPLPFKMGVPNLGGPMVTASGVAFLTSTLDYYIRAYDVATGDTLWQERLPAGGQATPMTYVGEDGRQYVLAVAGGHGSLGTKAGDYVIAYRID